MISKFSNSDDSVKISVKHFLSYVEKKVSGYLEWAFRKIILKTLPDLALENRFFDFWLRLRVKIKQSLMVLAYNRAALITHWKKLLALKGVHFRLKSISSWGRLLNPTTSDVAAIYRKNSHFFWFTNKLTNINYYYRIYK